MDQELDVSFLVFFLGVKMKECDMLMCCGSSGHEFFTEGLTLELVLGDTESDWGTGEEDLPPSMNAGGIKL